MMSLEEGQTRKEKESQLNHQKKIHSECPGFLTFPEADEALISSYSRKERMTKVVESPALDDLDKKFLENEIRILDWRIGMLLLRKNDLLSDRREEKKQINFFSC